MWHIMIFRVTGFCAQPYEVVRGHSFGWVRKSDVHASCLLSTNSTSFARWQLVVTTACGITGDGQGAVKSFNPNRGERVVVMTTARKRANVLGRGMSIITAEAPAVRPSVGALLQRKYARPSTSSSLRITDRSFQYASPRLWNQLPAPLRQPRTNLSNSASASSMSGTSSIGSIDSPLSSSITPSLFHSRLKTFLFCKSFPP